MSIFLMIIFAIFIWLILSKEIKQKNIRNEEKKTLLFEATNIKDFEFFISDRKHQITLREKSQIPPNKIHYEYIGKGKFIRKIKYSKSKSTLPEIPDEIEQRSLDYANSCGTFSPIYKADDIISLIFKQMNS